MVAYCPCAVNVGEMPPVERKTAKSDTGSVQSTVTSKPLLAVIAFVSPSQPTNSYPAAAVAVKVSVRDDASWMTFVVTIAAAGSSPRETVPPMAETNTVFTRFPCASNAQPAGSVSVAGFAPRKRTASTAALTASSSAVSTRSYRRKAWHVPMNGHCQSPGRAESPPITLSHVVLRHRISLLSVVVSAASAPSFQMPRSVGAAVSASVAESPLGNVVACVVYWFSVLSEASAR